MQVREPLLQAVNYLTRHHVSERRRNLWFLVEAKAERSSNLIRAAYILIWLLSTLPHVPGNAFWSNLANVGVGGVWLAWSIAYQAYLLRRPYRTSFKYISTTVDMVIITAMLFLYQYTYDYAYALKVPTFFNYFLCLGLAAMRYRLYLALYGGAVAVICYLALCGYFFLAYDVRLGSGLQHTISDRISVSYLLFNVLYLVTFTLLIYFLVYNVYRLVDLRVREGEAALKAKERALIAANVAHEIKNPLEGIYGAAQLLKEEGKGNPRFVDMVLKDSVRLNGVVQEFLQFSRPFRLKWADFDAVQAVREFCREQEAVAGEGKVLCTTSLESAGVRADWEGVRQALLNLYQNASRYQLPGRAVEIGVRERGEAVEIVVEDDGVGIPEEHRDRLFDPFFTTSAQGTGLGLAISRKLAREMGGDLYFEPKHPGARFVLVLKPGKVGEAVA